jgi:two-component system, response regulator PdtaR
VIRKMRVLVVDDDRDQLIVRCMLVSHHGFATIRASDADSEAKLAVSQRAEIAVLDINLPTREIGLKLLADLKSANPALYVIVITGTDPTRLREHPEMRLADEVLVKGASAKALLASLKRVSERRVAGDLAERCASASGSKV